MGLIALGRKRAPARQQGLADICRRIPYRRRTQGGEILRDLLQVRRNDRSDATYNVGSVAARCSWFPGSRLRPRSGKTMFFIRLSALRRLSAMMLADQAAGTEPAMRRRPRRLLRITRARRGRQAHRCHRQGKRVASPERSLGNSPGRVPLRTHPGWPARVCPISCCACRASLRGSRVRR